MIPLLSDRLNLIDNDGHNESTTFHRRFYLFDVNAYSLIPLRSTIKVSVVPIDVIHPIGFYSFGIKIDAIPGRINPVSSSRSLNKGENRGFRSYSTTNSSNIINVWIRFYWFLIPSDNVILTIIAFVTFCFIQDSIFLQFRVRS